jgi:prepilin-type N-terminal cleavage/methylation domain-containing protein
VHSTLNKTVKADLAILPDVLLRKGEKEMRAFSLIELIVTVCIVAVLSSFLMPYLSNALCRSRSAVELSNLRQLGVAAISYANEHDGVYCYSNGSSGSLLWVGTLWPYAYNTPFPGLPQANGNWDLFRGTIFSTPLLEKVAVYGGPPRAFGMNYQLNLSYPSARLWNLIAPSQTAYIGDTKTSSTWQYNQVNARYNGQVHILFADMHVELMPYTNISSSAGNIFWSGHY